MLSTVQIKWDMFGKIYPQSAAHITTIHGCFTILHFTDPRSLVLDPRFRFPIPDPAFPVKQLFARMLGCWSFASRSDVRHLEKGRCPISPQGSSCFPENEKTLGTRLDISWIWDWEKDRSMIAIFGFGV